MGKTNFLLDDSLENMFAELPDEQAGQLIKAMFAYHVGKDFEIDDPVLAAVFNMIRAMIDENDRKYDEACEKRSKAAASRWKKDDASVCNSMQVHANASDSMQNHADNDSDNDNKEKVLPIGNTKKKNFQRPTVEDVRAYCAERNNGIDAERFIDYYESNGWKVGRNAMKDWKAAVRSWERNTPKGKSPPNRFNNFENSQKYDFAAIEANALKRFREG